MPWDVDAPNAGFMLLDGDTVVGAHLAFYSERTIDGRRERFCNLGAWCVLPEHRFHGLRLLKALLAQDGYHFTDLSPSGNVVPLNERLGFRCSTPRTALVPEPAVAVAAGPRRISADPAVIERTLTGRELELYRDHRGTTRPATSCSIRGERVVLRRLPQGPAQEPPAVRLDPAREPPRPVPAAGAAARPPPAAAPRRARRSLTSSASSSTARAGRSRLRSPRRKMFRSPRLEPAQIDYLYSELVCVSW